MRLRVALFLLMVLLLTPVFAQEPVASEDEPLTHRDAPSWATVGFIFNTPNLLLDVDAYQGGFGLAYRSPLATLRLLALLGFESGTGTFEARFGATYTQPFFTGRVSPYWGFLAEVGFESERSEADEYNYTRAMVRNAKAGGVLGVEMLIFDFLSVFAEYQLALGTARTMIEQRVEGELQESSARHVALGVGMGNNGSVGIVIYLRPLGILDSERGEK